MAEKKSTAHTEHPGGGKQDFPPFQKDTFASQLVWLVLIFGVLYLLMSRVELPRIGQIMASRQDRIEADLAEARRLKDESDAAIAAYEKALADARGRAQALANETRERYAREAEAARKALDGVLPSSRSTIAAAASTAMSFTFPIASMRFAEMIRSASAMRALRAPSSALRAASASRA